ncbi:ADP-ribosylation factor-like protein 16 [Mactra antiquata]
MCLVIGPTGVGKTLLIKRLEQASSASKKGSSYIFNDLPSTIPTVGTSLVNVSVNNRFDVTLRELGGSMGPIWKNYFKDIIGLMYVVDISNRLQVAAACIQLLTVLSANNLPVVPVLLVFNKTDVPDKFTKSEIESLFRLSEIVKHCGRQVEQVDVSACTGQGVGDILKWLEQNCHGK